MEEQQQEIKKEAEVPKTKRAYKKKNAKFWKQKEQKVLEPVPIIKGEIKRVMPENAIMVLSLKEFSLKIEKDTLKIFRY